MKTFLSYSAVFLLGVGATLWLTNNINDSSRGKSTEKLSYHSGLGQVPPLTQKQKESQLFPLGIRSGDVITAVDGKTDPNMLQRLALGVQKGQVCVQYKRNDKQAEICLNSGKQARIPDKAHSTSAQKVIPPKSADMTQAFEDYDVAKELKNRRVPYVKDGKIQGFLKPEDIPDHLPMNSELRQAEEEVQVMDSVELMDP